MTARPARATSRPFYNNCVNWEDDVLLLHFLQDDPVDLSRETFLKHVDRQDLALLEEQLGYDRNLRMSGDPYVQYRREPKTGIPYFVHSAIEYVFATRDDIDNLKREAEAWRAAEPEEEPDCDQEAAGPDF